MTDALGKPPPGPMAAPSQPTEEPDDTSAIMTKAEEYALNYPHRAAVIRANGGLPDNVDFDAPAPDLVNQIVSSTSPVLRSLDTAAA